MKRVLHSSPRCVQRAGTGHQFQQKGNWRQVVMSIGFDLIRPGFKCWAHHCLTV